MDDHLKGLLFGSLVGDALTLGAHWIYNPMKIKRLYDRVTDYVTPLSDSYHASKGKGDFTHYGDQTMVVLESISQEKRFDLQDFSTRWQELFADYSGYIDVATKETLQNLQSGKTPDEGGSSSN